MSNPAPSPNKDAVHGDIGHGAVPGGNSNDKDAKRPLPTPEQNMAQQKEPILAGRASPLSHLDRRGPKR